ncbi:MAG: ParA family protein, partial [Cyanobacteria bacterium P01_B01_bin.77]
AKMQDQAHVILNAVPANKTVEHDSQQAIKAMGLNLAPMTIGNRIGFSHAFTSGQGIAEFKASDKGANEIRQLGKWAMELL